MYPHERSLVKRLANQPFALIGVNSDQDRKQLKKTMEEEKITWRSFWDGGSTNGPISSKWNVHGWPTIYVLDHKGVIRHKWVGSPADYKLGGLPDEKAIDSALGKLIQVAEADQKKAPK